MNSDVNAVYTKGLANDLVLLASGEKASEDDILQHLKKRHAEDIIYTYIGAVLVSVNPFKPLGLYTPAIIQSYSGKFMHEMPPHIFALAEETYRSLNTQRRGQCIIISGESGAGKTEAAKQILMYVAAVSKGSAEIQRVKEQILKSNPVLEAFGNAKTLRNNNSSRFGKYFDVVFDFKGDPIGGRITNYLLEKSRVVAAAKGERNFHIFYQLCRGAPDMNLGDPGQYTYISRTDSLDVEHMDDVEEFKTTKSAMVALGFPDQQIHEIFTIVGAILHLGQIEFENENKGSTDERNPEQEAFVKDDAPLQKVAQMLQCNADLLRTALIKRLIQAGRRKSIVFKALNAEDAGYTRDALAKAVYVRLFNFLVDHINRKIDPTVVLAESKEYADKGPVESILSACSSIGVLDIYGFEIFGRNSFEQFCINFVNEKLQQIFIENTLKTEQEEYAKEKINWVPVKFFNNKVVCDLIESKMGFISLLDEEGILPRGSDVTFLAKMDKQFDKHAHYVRPRMKQGSTIFTIKHYAGDVEYDCAGFMEKNKDALFKDLVMVGESSELSVMKLLFPEGGAADMGSKRPVTSGYAFRKQVWALMETLKSCTPHYVRCIKPNHNKAPNEYEDSVAAHQIRYLGLVENVRVRRAGFAFRQSFDGFLRRYKMLCKRTWPFWTSSSKDGTTAILDEHKVQADIQYQLGLTKLFIREPQILYMLEDKRRQRLHDMATQIAARWRGYIARYHFRRMVASLRIQTRWRGYVARVLFKREKSALIVQRNYRGHLGRVYAKRYRAAKIIQTNWRGFAARLWVKRYRAARAIQTRWRGVASRLFVIKLRACLRIQKNFRAYRNRKHYLEARSRTIQIFTPPAQKAQGVKHRRVLSVRRVEMNDYLTPGQWNSLLAVLRTPNKKYPTLARLGQGDVKFACGVWKINRSCEKDERFLAVTQKDLILFGPKDKDKEDNTLAQPTRARAKTEPPPRSKGTGDAGAWVLKQCVSLHAITGLSLSPLADNFLIVHCASTFDTLYECEYKCELVSLLLRLLEPKAPPVYIKNELSFALKKGLFGQGKRTVAFAEQKGEQEAVSIAKRQGDSSTFEVTVVGIPVASDDMMRKLQRYYLAAKPEHKNAEARKPPARPLPQRYAFMHAPKVTWRSPKELQQTREQDRRQHMQEKQLTAKQKAALVPSDAKSERRRRSYLEEERKLE